jgi:hypothetical protein
MHPTCPVFDGVLFFPVTPFSETGEVDLDLLARHVGKGVDAGPRRRLHRLRHRRNSTPSRLRSSVVWSGPP